MTSSEFQSELSARLQAKGFNTAQIEGICEEIKSIMEGFILIKHNQKAQKTKMLKKYRIRFKTSNEKSKSWDAHMVIKQALYAKDAKAAVATENPGCKISSVWLLPDNIA